MSELDIAEDIKALQLDSSAEDNVTAAVEDGKPDAVEDGKPDAVVSSDKTDLGNFRVHMADERPSIFMKFEKLSNNFKVLDEVLANIKTRTTEENEQGNEPNQTLETVPHDVELPIEERTKQTAIQNYLHILNTANKEQLEATKGIEVKIANLILEHREICPQPFRTLEDLGRIGLSEKQGKDMIIKWIEGLFD